MSATAWEFIRGTGEHWGTLAACRDDPDAMWPPPRATRLIQAAREKCSTCAVQIRCIADGIDAEEWESVRGGYTGAERKAFHLQGLAPGNYPPPEAPPLPVRTCRTCRQPFEVTPDRRTARACRDCIKGRVKTTAVCVSCQRTKAIHARGMCDSCHRKSTKVTELRPCGTEAAYKRHLYRGEKPCTVCVDAMRPIWKAQSLTRRRPRRERT